MKIGGKRNFERNLRFEREERESFRSVGERRRRVRVGSTKNFSIKRERPKDFIKNYKFTLGSTLGVDSWHKKIQKNDRKISKKN